MMSGLVLLQEGGKSELIYLQFTTNTHRQSIGQLPLDKKLYLISEHTFKMIEAELPATYCQNHVKILWKEGLRPSSKFDDTEMAVMCELGRTACH